MNTVNCSTPIDYSSAITGELDIQAITDHTKSVLRSLSNVDADTDSSRIRYVNVLFLHTDESISVPFKKWTRDVHYLIHDIEEKIWNVNTFDYFPPERHHTGMKIDIKLNFIEVEPDNR